MTKNVYFGRHKALNNDSTLNTEISRTSTRVNSDALEMSELPPIEEKLRNT